MTRRALLIGTTRYLPDLVDLEAGAHRYEPGDTGQQKVIWKPLPAARNDVEVLAAALERGGWDAVTRLVDRGLTDVEEAIHDVVTASSRQDTLLIYVSGHGELDVDGRLYFPLRHTKPRFHPRGTGALRSANFLEAVKRSTALDTIVVLDCCYAGQLTYDAVSGKGGEGDLQEVDRTLTRFGGELEDAVAESPAPAVQSQGAGPVRTSRGWAYLCASGQRERAYVGEGGDLLGQPLSVFTGFLVEALDAATATGRALTVDQLEKHLQNRFEHYRPPEGVTRQNPVTLKNDGRMVVVDGRVARGSQAASDPAKKSSAKFRLVGQASLAEFSVTRPRRRKGLPSSPPFVPRAAVDRDLDAAITGALANQRWVLVQGPVHSGRARSAAEAVRRALPGALLVTPGRNNWPPDLPTAMARARAQIAAAVDGPSEVLVWLRDAVAHLGPGQLSLDLIIGENSVPDLRVLVLGIISNDDAQLVTTARGPAVEDVYRTLHAAHIVNVPLALTEQEYRDAKDRIGSDNLSTRLGEFVAGSFAGASWWGNQENRDVTAEGVLRQAAKWRRSHFLPHLTEETLRRLYAAQYGGQRPAAEVNTAVRDTIDHLLGDEHYPMAGLHRVGEGSEDVEIDESMLMVVEGDETTLTPWWMQVADLLDPEHWLPQAFSAFLLNDTSRSATAARRSFDETTSPAAALWEGLTWFSSRSADETVDGLGKRHGVALDEATRALHHVATGPNGALSAHAACAGLALAHLAGEGANWTVEQWWGLAAASTHPYWSGIAVRIRAQGLLAEGRYEDVLDLTGTAAARTGQSAAGTALLRAAAVLRRARRGGVDQLPSEVMSDCRRALAEGRGAWRVEVGVGLAVRDLAAGDHQQALLDLGAASDRRHPIQGDEDWIAENGVWAQVERPAPTELLDEVLLLCQWLGVESDGPNEDEVRKSPAAALRAVWAADAGSERAADLYEAAFHAESALVRRQVRAGLARSLAANGDVRSLSYFEELWSWPHWHPRREASAVDFLHVVLNGGLPVPEDSARLALEVATDLVTSGTRCEPMGSAVLVRVRSAELLVQILTSQGSGPEIAARIFDVLDGAALADLRLPMSKHGVPIPVEELTDVESAVLSCVRALKNTLLTVDLAKDFPPDAITGHAMSFAGGLSTRGKSADDLLTCMDLLTRWVRLVRVLDVVHLLPGTAGLAAPGLVMDVLLHWGPILVTSVEEALRLQDSEQTKSRLAGDPETQSLVFTVRACFRNAVDHAAAVLTAEHLLVLTEALMAAREGSTDAETLGIIKTEILRLLDKAERRGALREVSDRRTAMLLSVLTSHGPVRVNRTLQPATQDLQHRLLRLMDQDVDHRKALGAASRLDDLLTRRLEKPADDRPQAEQSADRELLIKVLDRTAQLSTGRERSHARYRKAELLWTLDRDKGAELFAAIALTPPVLYQEPPHDPYAEAAREWKNLDPQQIGPAAAEVRDWVKSRNEADRDWHQGLLGASVALLLLGVTGLGAQTGVQVSDWLAAQSGWTVDAWKVSLGAVLLTALASLPLRVRWGPRRRRRRTAVVLTLLAVVSLLVGGSTLAIAVGAAVAVAVVVVQVLRRDR